MAVQYVNGGGGLLGTLGPLAMAAGALIPGAGALTPIGLGMSAANAAMSGNGTGALSSLLGGLMNGTGWADPSAWTAAPENKVSWGTRRARWGV